ncbi:MAG TPA: PAS domain S-box protein, partial [Gallionella sp.]|nr:PAS domain S-box protein [Gallionella sp.]
MIEPGMQCDLTESKRDEPSLLKQAELEQRQSQFFAMAPGFFATVEHLTDGSFAMPFASEGIRDLFGIEPDAAMRDFGLPVALMHPDDIEMVFRKTDESERDLSLFHVEYRICHPDKGIRWVECRAQPRRLPDGSTQWQGFYHDISERKCSEALRKQREREFRILAENFPDSIVRYNREARAVYVNPELKRLMGDRAATMLGLTPREHHPDGVFEDFAKLLDTVLASGEAGELEKAFPGPDGTVSIYQIRVVPERIENGEVVGALSCGRNITKLKHYEQSLQARAELEQRQSQFFAMAPGFFYTSVQQANGHNSMPFASPGIRVMFGLEPADVAQDSEPLLALIYPDDREQRLRLIDESARNMTRLHYECRYNHPQKGVCWLEADSLPQSAPNGGIRWDGFMHDITERKRMEEAMRESGAKLRSLYELSPLGIALTDMHGRFLDFNEAFRAICDYPSEELITLDYWTLTPREYETQEGAQLESLAKTGRYGPYEKEYRRKDGTLIPIQLNGMLITGRDGQQFIWSIVEDIRERKRIEAELKGRLERIVELNDHLEKTARDLEDQTVELKASQEQLKQTEAWYRSIMHSAPDGMLVVDERGLIIQANMRLESMFGYGRCELHGLNVEALLPQSLRESHVGLRSGYWGSGADHRMAMVGKTLFGCRKDGSTFPVEVSLSRLPEIDGMSSAICAAVRDITERQKMEAAREAALAEALRLARLRSAFMAQMSHELRTPLNGILGYAQNLLLQSGALDDKQITGLRIIQNSGEHLLTLINGILDHAAIEADKFELIPGDIELEIFLSTIIGIIRVRAEQKNIAFNCEADAGLPAVVRGDAQRLRQVLLNLLANAVKFTDYGQVTLHVSYTAPSRLRFAVQDSGVGIAAEQLETIFQPFEQTGETHRRAGGNGLGLAISRKLVRLMGGDIKVESQPGAGSTFSFEIDMETVQSDTAPVNVAALAEPASTPVAQASAQLFAPPLHE